MGQNAITVKDAAAILGLSYPMAHYLVATDKIKPIGQFGRSFILDRKQIEVLKEQRERDKTPI